LASLHLGHSVLLAWVMVTDIYYISHCPGLAMFASVPSGPKESLNTGINYVEALKK